MHRPQPARAIPVPVPHARGPASRPGPGARRAVVGVGVAALGCFVLAATGCKKKTEGAATPPTGGAATGSTAGAAQAAGAATAGAAPSPAAPAEIVGMTDPVGRMQSATAKALQRGYKGLNAKKWDECIAGFSEVTSALPDYLTSRYYVARCQLMQGSFADARGQLEELLRRSYVSYAGRAAASKDFATLRSSPEWAAYQQAEARIKQSYARGLDAGVTLVMRMSAAKPAKFEPVKGGEPGLREAKLELAQEAVHYDPATGRFRPLTLTDGRVLSALRSPDGKKLAFVTAEKAQNQGSKLWLVDPQIGHIDLATLETVGPVPIKGRFAQLSLGFSKAGEPTLYAVEVDGQPGASFQMDTARTGAVKVPEEQGVEGERNEIWVDDLQHTERRVPADIKLAADLQSFTVGEGAAGPPVTSAQKIEGSSILWSPGKLLLSYAGVYSACAALDKTKGDKDKNGLFLFDPAKKSAQRIDAARTTYETQWAGDTFLVFETGIDADSRVTVYDTRTQQKTVLPTRHGAGLYGISAHKCEEPPQSEPADAAEGAGTLPPPPAAPAE